MNFLNFKMLKFFYKKGGFKLFYYLCFFKESLKKEIVNSPKKLVFIISETDSGWILERISKEISFFFDGEVVIHKGNKDVPKGDIYFFMHYLLLLQSLRNNPNLLIKNIYCWFTHPGENFEKIKKELIWLINFKVKIFSACTLFKDMLISEGAKQKNIKVVIGGADENFFSQKVEKNTKKIGLCSAFYERKNPELILDLVTSCQDYQFILLGKNWENWNKFEDLNAFKNFEYIQLPYNKYPEFYQSIDIFLSTSSLEGGPIPLIEAMMSGCKPVTSDTGFAKDLITDGENGVIFPINAKSSEVIECLKKSERLKVENIRKSVLCYSWKKFSVNVNAELKNNLK